MPSRHRLPNVQQIALESQKHPIFINCARAYWRKSIKTLLAVAQGWSMPAHWRANSLTDAGETATYPMNIPVPARRRGYTWLPVILSAFLLILSVASTPVKAEPEEVVVIGTAFEKVTTHVSALRSVSLEDQIARWNRPLCLRDEGLAEEHHQTLRNRVTRATRDIRISLADEGCNPNVMLFFSADAKTTAEQLNAHFEIPLRQAGPQRVRQFLESEAPVRWITTFDPCGFGCRLANSRITASTAPALQLMIVVVDVPQIQQHNFQSVADYLAFVMLTNPSPEGSPALDSILSLFSSSDTSSGVVGLSLYDRLYIEALYWVPMDQYASRQGHAISSRMMSLLASAQE